MVALPFAPWEQPAILEIRLPSNLDFLTVARTAGRIFVHALPGGEALFKRVELALVESVTNAIRHGNTEDPSRAVEIALEWSPPKLAVVVADHGDPFELPPEGPRDAPPAVETHGRGLFLMRTMSDDLRVERKNTGNLVTLTWRVSSQTDE